MILGIVLRYKELDNEGHWRFVYKMQHDFQLMAEKHGITLCAIVNHYDAEKLAQLCDGLIIPGSGNPLFAQYYGGEPETEPYPVDEYGHDSKIVDLFVKAGKPVFGVCQGLQMLNIYFGGSIHRVNTNNYHNIPGNDQRQRHPINIQKDSFVYDVFGKERVTVNSHHYWGIDRLGKGLRVVATADDGVIEAVENRELGIFATQWHPEQHFHGDDPIEQKFFENFIAYCKK